MKWYDSLIIDKIASDFYSACGTQLISIDRKGFQPKAVFAVSSHADKEKALAGIKKEYDARILKLEQKFEHRLEEMIGLVLHSAMQPRNLILGRDSHHLIHDMSIRNSMYVQAIEEIKGQIEEEDAASFKGNPKKKILEMLDNTITGIETGTLNETGKKIFDSLKDDLAPFVYKFATQYTILQSLNQFIK
ncbi:MAG: hypothetical protein ACYC9O_04465 [Candidatus Latescibacterota bacterium]